LTATAGYNLISPEETTMKTHLSFVSAFTATTLLFIFLIFCFAPALAQAWKPLDPAHLALKAPVVEKDADAEALLWEVYINTASDSGTDFIHFVRVKIFTERGKETQSKIDIPYLSGVSVKDVAGRTIKPDGTIIELKKDAIFDRELIKAGRFKLKAKSFALPGIEPGAIIEYRWREVYGYITNYVKMELQRDIPTQVVRYYLKPNPYVVDPMKTVTFQANPPQFVKEKDGYYRVELTNMPAFREEPHMPPEDQVKAWMLVYYAPDVKKAPMEYWKEEGKRTYEQRKGDMKVNDDIRRASVEAVGDAATPEQKLERIFNFCRTKIKNVNDDASGLTAEQREKLKENRSPADTLKRGYGSGPDINFLFAALATAAGFDARYVRIGDRSRKFYDPNFTDTYFMRAYNIAVKMGDQWRFFDPGSGYIPFGMLRWQEEGIQALVTDPKEPQFVRTPISPAEKTAKKRTAKLKLSEDGALEGEVRIEYTGHFAVEMKEDNDEETAEQREKKLNDSVKGRLAGAELSDIKIESANDPLKPFVYSYKVRVPGYAERTGKRLFLQPAFFQKGLDQMFPTSARQHDIYFHYPWAEADHVIIELPEGFALDNAEAPGGINFGDAGHYKVAIGITKDLRALEYKREFQFNELMLPKSVYPNLKRVFEAIHQSDNHAITLKQGAATAAKP
jgi:transglutaminase-like putative cysteine protease